jgi:molybdopterin-guanine dinucleotide biosynthesis protein A
MDPAPIRRPDPELAGLVLCGGASRRMGRDKALIELGGATLLARAIEVLDRVAAPVMLACGPRPRYAELGRPLVLDAGPDLGPLGGLAAGLETAELPYLAVLACDLPGATPALFAALLDRARGLELDAVLFETGAGPEPLLAVYRRAILPAVRRALARGDRRMTAFHAEIRAGRLGAHERRDSPGAAAADPALNVNAPEDLERAAADAARAELGRSDSR